jgi:hypothetical protein
MYNDTKTIIVTQEDIDRGVREDCGKCPVAIAASRVFTDIRWISVTDTIEFGEQPAGVQVWSLPPEASQFIDAFDNKRHVEPFEFVTEYQYNA